MAVLGNGDLDLADFGTAPGGFTRTDRTVSSASARRLAHPWSPSITAEEESGEYDVDMFATARWSSFCSASGLPHGAARPPTRWTGRGTETQRQFSDSASKAAIGPSTRIGPGLVEPDEEIGHAADLRDPCVNSALIVSSKEVAPDGNRFAAPAPTSA